MLIHCQGKWGYLAHRRGRITYGIGQNPSDAMATAPKKTTARAAYPTDALSHLADVTDRMHGLLMERADALMGCTENSPEEAELEALTDVIEAYERQRWS